MHHVAVEAVCSKGPWQVVVDDATVALRLLVDRRDGLSRANAELRGLRRNARTRSLNTAA
jgi:transposase